MRKLVLLVAVVSLSLAPPALAGDKNPERQSVCQVPDIDMSYDTETFTTMVSLPISGCQSRENTEFILSATISRRDSNVGRDMVERSALCGPFRSADESGQDAPQYSCNLGVFLSHPEVESAQYDIDVSYPGARQQRTDRVFTFCTSDGTTAACEH